MFVKLNFSSRMVAFNIFRYIFFISLSLLALDCSPKKDGELKYYEKNLKGSDSYSEDYEKHVNNLIKKWPETALGYYYQGILIREKDSEFEAYEYFRKAAELNPNMSIAWKWSAKCYADKYSYFNDTVAFLLGKYLEVKNESNPWYETPSEEVKNYLKNSSDIKGLPVLGIGTLEEVFNLYRNDYAGKEFIVYAGKFRLTDCSVYTYQDIIKRKYFCLWYYENGKSIRVLLDRNDANRELIENGVTEDFNYWLGYWPGKDEENIDLKKYICSFDFGLSNDDY